MSFRLLHTSDWHLGRALHGESLLEDQSHALDQLFGLLRDERPHALVISGDVYDRAVPPAEAVALLDDFLTRVRGDLALPVVLLAGNHDSGERLSFGSRLLERQGLHVRGSCRRAGEPVALQGDGVTGFVYPVPYVDPEVVRAESGEEGLRGHAQATAFVLARARADAADRGGVRVLAAHAFVDGAAQSESERALTVGGSGAVPPEAFGGFDYVALGHLHAPQAAGDERLRYSGSLLKYSFGEAAQEKGVELVELAPGKASVRRVQLTPRRDVVRLQGTLAQLLGNPDLERHRGDLVQATLTDEGYVIDAIGKLRQRFSCVLEVQRAGLALAAVEGSFAARLAAAGGDDLRLFEGFFADMTGGPPGEAERELFREAFEEVARAGREA
ncbi:MAG TPA: exonuclease SbcCD subunit D [Anaeromyxobacteraceae bacterium]|jgi:exonuclease SbcD|nr:exonuclease SbcCD subunit D [Anaeromyxobacteraceae bacterium]